MLKTRTSLALPIPDLITTVITVCMNALSVFQCSRSAAQACHVLASMISSLLFYVPGMSDQHLKRKFEFLKILRSQIIRKSDAQRFLLHHHGVIL